MPTRRLPQIIDYAPLDIRPHCADSLSWEIHPSRCALLIHDMQRHFLEPFAPSTILPVLKNILSLREQCDALKIPVYYSVQPAAQDNAQRGLLLDFWGPGLQDQPERAEVVDSLTPLAHHHPFDKWRYSAFAKTSFLQTLRESGRDQLMVTGVYGHIGCHATVRDAFMNDIQPFAIGDAMADFSEEELHAALRDIAHRCGVVCSTSFALHELARDTQTCEPGARASQDSPHSAVQRFFIALTDHPEPPVPLHAELMDLGIDSVRWMTAIDVWNQEFQAKLPWEAVAACESVGALFQLLEQHSQVQA